MLAAAANGSAPARGQEALPVWKSRRLSPTLPHQLPLAISKLIASECLCNLCYFSRGGIGLKTNSNLRISCSTNPAEAWR